MDFRQLYYFKTIAETENLSQASRRLHISQPYLSRTIRALEEELEVTLFDRHGKKIVLNENGQILYYYASKILQLQNQALEDLKKKSPAQNQSLRIAMINATSIFPEMIAKFCYTYPDISFSILRFTSLNEIPENCDIMIHASESLAQNLNTTILFQEECLLGMSVHHPLASMESITPELLKNETFLLLTQENTLGELTRRYFKPLKIQPKIPLQCDNQQTLTAFVEQGLGLAFFPSKTWRTENSKILLRKIEDYNLQRNIYLSLTEENVSPAAKTFRNFAVSYIQHLNEQK